MSDPQYDLVVFGATSFVGSILTRYLAATFGTDGRQLRWAVAGRSPEKLAALRDALGEGGQTLPVVVADAGDEEALQRLCADSRVVVSTVGPYALYGEPLVRACVESGTDYCDLTGEIQWIRRMLRRYEQRAGETGARIVHCCGFDSIPSDLGVYFLQQQARARFGEPATRVKMRVRAIRGGMSGGTVASLVNVIQEARRDRQLRRELADPYSLCPEGHGQGVRQPRIRFAGQDPDFGAWVAPFIMAPVNTRVVLRSNALAGAAGVAGLQYDEALMTGRGVRGGLTAAVTALATGGFAMAAALAPFRRLLQRFVLPGPGEGPSPEAQERGFYDLRFHGRTADGRELRVQVTGDRDPGYGSTGKMLGQAAACLALDMDRDSVPGGFWTPSTIFGDRLLHRLEAHAGLAFRIQE